MNERGARRRRGADGFRPLEAVAAAAGSLIRQGERGRHLRAMAAWRSAVGGRVNRVTRVAGFHRGAVTVEVPDRVWGETLRRMEPQILERLREGLGDEARRIEYRVVQGFWRPPRPVRPTVAARPPQPAEPATEGEERTPPEVQDLPEPLTDTDLPVRDPGLREALCRIGNRYLLRGGLR